MSNLNVKLLNQSILVANSILFTMNWSMPKCYAGAGLTADKAKHEMNRGLLVCFTVDLQPLSQCGSTYSVAICLSWSVPVIYEHVYPS